MKHDAHITQIPCLLTPLDISCDILPLYKNTSLDRIFWLACEPGVLMIKLKKILYIYSVEVHI